MQRTQGKMCSQEEENHMGEEGDKSCGEREEDTEEEKKEVHLIEEEVKRVQEETQMQWI